MAVGVGVDHPKVLVLRLTLGRPRPREEVGVLGAESVVLGEKVEVIRNKLLLGKIVIKCI